MANTIITSLSKNFSQTPAVPAKPNTLKNKIAKAPKPLAPPLAAAPSKPVTAKAKNTSPATIVSLEKSKVAEKQLYSKTGNLEKQPAPPTNGFVASSGDVVVDIKNSDSGYNNKIYWSSDNFKTRNYLGIDNNTGSFNLGKFAEGTKIEFGIDNGAGSFFKTGAASNNADNLEHAKVTNTAEGTQIGFEDLHGGGDKDFNDAIINVRNVPSNPEVNTKSTDVKKETKSEPKDTPIAIKNTSTKSTTSPKSVPIVTPENIKVAPKVTPKVENIFVTKVVPNVEIKNAIPSNNRSGLGDGTNPGQGDGRTNSTNQGTNNPSKASNYVVQPAAISQFKLAV